MALSETYNSYTTLWDFLPKGKPRTVANQMAAAAYSLVTNWLNTGTTIWSTNKNSLSSYAPQPCADWLYKYAYAADTYIGIMNEQPFAGRPEFFVEVDELDDEDDENWAMQLNEYGVDINDVNVDAEKADIEEYDKMLDNLLYVLNDDYNIMLALDKIPAVDSIDNCQGPVYDIAMAYQG